MSGFDEDLAFTNNSIYINLGLFTDMLSMLNTEGTNGDKV